jgi:hypothetical protein
MVLTGAVALLLVGCLSADPNHCANLMGNATCVANGEGAFCSICASANAGCVDTEPEKPCYRPGRINESESDPGTTETTEATETTAGSSEDTVPADCMGDGLDEACPATAPYCVEGTCSDCNDAGAEFCSGIDSQVPECHPGSGLCVGCVGNSGCDVGVCGDAYACVECTQHSDCPGSACDLRIGQCLADANEAWVEPTGCTPPGFGTEDSPYCAFADALANIDEGENWVVHVRSSAPITEGIDLQGVADRTLVLLGEDRPSLDGGPTAIAVGTRSAIFVDGVRIIDSEQAGATCIGQSVLWFSDVDFEGNATGITATGCTRVVVERSTILGNTRDGIHAEDTKLSVISSALVDNGTAGDTTSAIWFSNSELDVRYSTFAANRGLTGASISCGGTGEIRNSILVSIDAPSLNCDGVELRSSAVDDAFDGEGVVVVDGYDPGWFFNPGGGDVRPQNPNGSPFRDVAVWGQGDPLRDLSGERRLAYPGLAEFAGAHQP